MSGDRYSVQEYEVRLDLLQCIHAEFITVHRKIMEIVNESMLDQVEAYEKIAVNMEEKYTQIKSNLNRCISSFGCRE